MKPDNTDVGWREAPENVDSFKMVSDLGLFKMTLAI